MIGEPKPTQRQRQLEARLTELERAHRETAAQLTSLVDEVGMMGHHLARERTRRTDHQPQVLQ